MGRAEVLDDQLAGAEVWLEGCCWAGLVTVVVGVRVVRGAGEVYHFRALALDLGGHCCCCGGVGGVELGARALGVGTGCCC
jgi:hypothetical protein